MKYHIFHSDLIILVIHIHIFINTYHIHPKVYLLIYALEYSNFFLDLIDINRFYEISIQTLKNSSSSIYNYFGYIR